jgi:Flp pilus assembly protein TadG
MRRGSNRGNALVEFAVSFSLIWVLFSGVFQIGYATYIYNSLVTQVGNSARYAARIDFDSTNTNVFTTRVRNMVLFGNPQGSGSVMIPDLKPEQIRVSWSKDAAGLIETVTVSIEGYAINGLLREFKLTGKPNATVRYAGNYRS